MYKIDQCPACYSLNIVKTPCKLARFVVWRATQTSTPENVNTHAIFCSDCKYLGSDLRFTPEEESNLYVNYRDDEYNRIRIECEPNYAERLLTFKDVGSYYNDRKKVLEEIIRKNIDLESIKNVLDYGGDEGRFIPDCFPNAKKYVYEVSGAKPLPGIETYDIGNYNGPVDFIICAQLLEHMSDPSGLINLIKKLIDENSWVYFEVPNYPMPTLPPYFHEHINIFCRSSFSALLKRNGFQIIDTTELTGDCQPGEYHGNLGILVKLKVH